MRGEGEREAHRPGQLGAEQAGAEDPDLEVGTAPRHGPHPLSGLGRTKVGEELVDVVGEAVRAADQRPAQRIGRRLIGPRRAPEAEIDPPGMKRVERAELFGDDQRRVIGEHDPAGADPDGRRAGGDMRDGDRGRRAGDAGHVVVLGEPEAVVAPALRVLRQIDGVAKRLGGVAPLDDRRQIEDGQRNHGPNDSSRRGRSHRRACARVQRGMVSVFANSGVSGDGRSIPLACRSKARMAQY